MILLHKYQADMMLSMKPFSSMLNKYVVLQLASSFLFLICVHLEHAEMFYILHM
jgi:hypothetical protein